MGLGQPGGKMGRKKEGRERKIARGLRRERGEEGGGALKSDVSRD